MFKKIMIKIIMGEKEIPKFSFKMKIKNVLVKE